MYFHTGYCEHILFQQLQTNSKAEMIAACIAVFLVSLLFEGIRASREYMLSNAMLGSVNPSTSYDSEPKIAVPRLIALCAISRPLMTLCPVSAERLSKQGDKSQTERNKMFSSTNVIQTLLHALQVFMSYCLMVIFMTLNIYLCTAVVIGATVGHFLFGWMRNTVRDINEHCR